MVWVGGAAMAELLTKRSVIETDENVVGARLVSKISAQFLENSNLAFFHTPHLVLKLSNAIYLVHPNVTDWIKLIQFLN